MKRTLFLLLMLIALLVFACSEKDDNPTDTNIYGYKLDQFISKTGVHPLVDTNAADTTDYRALFAYEIVSADADGWSPRLSANAGYDLNWATLASGFIVPSDNRKTWFSDPSLPGAFKVKNTGFIRLYRKVDVETGRGTKLVELKGLQIHSTNNWNGSPEDAIKLSDLLQGIAVYDTVRLVAIDGYTKEYNAEQINDGYYLLNSEVTTFPSFNADWNNSQKKFKKLAKVEVLGVNSQVFDFALADSLQTNISFTIPQAFNGYTATILTGY